MVTRNNLIILTLKQHEDGIWISRLVKSLESLTKEGKLHQLADLDEFQSLTIKVCSLEEWLAEGLLVSSDLFETVIGIVNRVSDAASPHLYKACCAVLGTAQTLGIPIVNGPISYSLCGNKWCHHVLFQQAKLSSPTTFSFFNNGGDNKALHAKAQEMLPGASLLIKPNAGGFGAGICHITSLLEDDSFPTFEDSMILLQSYERPRDKKLYRVWFLQGKVQCAIERTVLNEESEFTNACAGSCSINQTPKAWKIPLDVKEEIEERLLPLLSDASCGSVEFLYAESNSKRLYFDLNLLSTLPIKVMDDNGIWEKDFDPWMELAIVCVKIFF